jgi:hypothetical protein
MQQNSRPASCGLRRRFGVLPLGDESTADFAIAALPTRGFAHELLAHWRESRLIQIKTGSPNAAGRLTYINA